MGESVGTGFKFDLVSLFALSRTHESEISPTLLKKQDTADLDTRSCLCSIGTGRIRKRRMRSPSDSFYMATSSSSGWPYLQHRGGPIGFIKVLNENTFGIADFRGNRQYISLGNLADDNRVCLFFMDYARQARLKILARVEVVEMDADDGVMEALSLPDYSAKVERGLLFHLHSFDWNCPQHITPKYSKEEIDPVIDELKQKIAQLQTQLNDT